MASALLASEVPRETSDLAGASLEELLRMPVTTVSKREQQLWRTPAAVFVLTQEDIRRSGLTSIPELLRLVPGLHVARINANIWSVSTRGFSGRYSDKLLVMIDRRSVYSPNYGGVDWDLQDVFVDDIERIEVVRGPGATMWGANAVNGVVHIITKSAHDTRGGLMTSGGGNDTRRFGGFRYGGRIGKNADYRAFAQYTDHGPLSLSGGGSMGDQWGLFHSGFRIDWDRTDHDSFTFQGDIYEGHVPINQTRTILTPPFKAAVTGETDRDGGNLLGRWRYSRSENSEFTLQLYYDRAAENGLPRNSATDIGDIDFQHRFRVKERHEVLWGLGYRTTAMRTEETFSVSYTPQQRTDGLATGFIQDEITLAPDRLWLTIGTKLEHNDYTGPEVQPGVRLLWTPSNRHSLWTTFARAVNTPSRTRSDIRINTSAYPMQGGGIGLIGIFGNKGYQTPSARTNELGYRFRATRNLSFDIASFYTMYSDLQTIDPGTPFIETEPAPVHTVFPQRFGNRMYGTTHGNEVVANWTPVKRWTLTGSYSFLHIHAHHLDGLLKDPHDLEGNSPRHQASARSLFSVRGVEFDTAAYYVGALPATGIPAYLRTDVRLGWRTKWGLDLSLAGQNLLDNRHPEYLQSDQRFPLADVGRSIQGRFVWRFGGGN